MRILQQLCLLSCIGSVLMNALRTGSYNKARGEQPHRFSFAAVSLDPLRLPIGSDDHEPRIVFSVKDRGHHFFCTAANNTQAVCHGITENEVQLHARNGIFGIKTKSRTHVLPGCSRLFLASVPDGRCRGRAPQSMCCKGGVRPLASPSGSKALTCKPELIRFTGPADTSPRTARSYRTESRHSSSWQSRDLHPWLRGTTPSLLASQAQRPSGQPRS
jgi:hypothetical protein